MGGIGVAAQRRADTVEFVSGNGRAHTTATDQYADFGVAVLHGFTDLFGVVGIIVRDRAIVGAEVR